MNTANKLTLARMVMIPVFVLCVLLTGPWADFFAILVFALASITDKLDGYVARKYNQITNLGKIMDPLADKLLVLSAFTLFVADGRISSIAFIIIIARELTITSMRVVAAGGGKVVAAMFSGKLKTVSQLVCILAILALPLLRAVGLNFLAEYELLISQILGWIAAAITLWSGIDYCIKLAPAIKEKA